MKNAASIKALALEVLTSLPEPYSENVIDDVFGAIERNSECLKRHKRLRDELSPIVVNTWIGRWIANAVGKTGERQVPSRTNRLINSYLVLDTDVRPIGRKPPKEDEARQMMWDYYLTHKNDLPPDVRNLRDLIEALILEGLTPDQAFQRILV